MLGDTPLNYIDINVMIKLKTGDLVPFIIFCFNDIEKFILKKQIYLLNYEK
jgi:hypothetical protein